MASVRSFFKNLFSHSNSSRTNQKQSSAGGDYSQLSEHPPEIQGTSCVYKGQLKDGAQIAVKRLKCSLFKDISDFCSEAQFLGKFHHRNLLSLKGYCAEGQERMLVFDYMPNSSLHAHLHGDLKMDGHLDWKKRVIIARGCAEALEYLHHDGDVELIHGNIKSRNVLLSAAYDPKVVDFGLWRLLKDSTATGRGAFGYVAPEDLKGEALSKRSDVFSFGILLLELISGKNPAEKIPSGPQKLSIVEWAQDLIMGGKLDELLDAKLNGKYNHEEVEVLLTLAIMCAQVKPEDRVTMREVVDFLKGMPEAQREIPECGNHIKGGS